MLLISACKITTNFLNKEEYLKKYANKERILTNNHKKNPFFANFFVPLHS